MVYGLVYDPRGREKKPQGPVTLLEVTNLACLRSLSRSRVGLRGPRALGHVFGKRFLFGAYRDEYVDCQQGYCAQSKQMKRARPHLRSMDRPPYHRAPRLGPRAFSVGGVDSLGGGFV